MTSVCVSGAVMRKPVPKPGPGEVLVRLHLRPIHPADAMSLAGALVESVPACLSAISMITSLSDDKRNRTSFRARYALHKVGSIGGVVSPSAAVLCCGHACKPPVLFGTASITFVASRGGLMSRRVPGVQASPSARRSRGPRRYGFLLPPTHAATHLWQEARIWPAGSGSLGPAKRRVTKLQSK